ncbi:MAG: RNA-binding cell elongation regulator Jag/EloR [Clostridiaceae bacterium]
MKTIEMAGSTVEAALKNALKELNVTEDKVTYEVIEQGSKGFLGFGSKPAKIKVVLKRDHITDAKEFLRSVLDGMDIKAEIRITESNNTLNIDLKGPNMGAIIGYRGETLDSLQYLTSLVVNKGNEGEYKRVLLDTENYRAKREETLKHLAFKMAKKVAKTKRTFKFEPMNPYERRIIHSALQNDKFVSTCSEGDEPHRRVVIELKKA